MSERIADAFRKADIQQNKIPAGNYFNSLGQKFLQDHEGEDSDAMLAQDLGRLLAIAWHAALIFASESKISSCME